MTWNTSLSWGSELKIEYQPGKWAESTITNMTWKFRGGWEFSCTGKDTRVLAQAAKRSLAFNSENASKRHADIVAASAKKIALAKADEAWNYADKNVSDIQNFRRLTKFENEEFKNAINALWDAINNL